MLILYCYAEGRKTKPISKCVCFLSSYKEPRKEQLCSNVSNNFISQHNIQQTFYETQQSSSKTQHLLTKVDCNQDTVNFFIIFYRRLPFGPSARTADNFAFDRRKLYENVGIV